jgi:protein-L-isoaspartate(D-aspartate) O-methyltransferase
MDRTGTPDFDGLRARMLEEIALYARAAAPASGRESLDARVMAAMGRVPRHEFVPEKLRRYAYENMPLPIGFEKTISQPFIIALMLDLLGLRPGDKVLEVGTGLGYQAALLAELASTVCTVEIVPELGAEARRRLDRLGYNGILTRIGDGSQGWTQEAPFDAVILAAAPETLPPRLFEQLAPGGRMVLPLGPEGEQALWVVTKDRAGRAETRPVLEVSFTALVRPH